jgi:hypothetical protein
MLTVKGKQFCPYCGKEVELKEGHSLVIRLFAPRNWYGVEHFRPDGSGYPLDISENGRRYCARFGYTLDEAVALIKNSFIKTEGA